MIFDVILITSSLISSLWLILQLIYFKYSFSYTKKELYSRNENNYYSIIIAVKNEEKETIKELIENLKLLDWENYEVIIISDDDEQRFNKIFDIDIPPNFKVIRREDPKDGKAGALNLASKLAKGEYLVFLDADARVEKDFLKKVNMRVRDANAVRLRIRNGNEGLIPNIYSSMNEFIMNSLYRGRYTLGLPIFPNGSALIIKKDTLEKIGYWKRYIAEDLELGIRLFCNSYPVNYIDEVSVNILSPYTYLDLYKQIERWAYGAGELFFNSFRMLKKGLKGIEGVIYVSQWLINSLFFLFLLLFSVLQPLLHVNYMSYFFSLIIYFFSLIIYQRFSRAEGNIRIALLTLFASIIGYFKGIFRLRYSWKVTRKIKPSEDSFPVNLRILGYLLIFTSFINALYSEWLTSLILLLIGLLII